MKTTSMSMERFRQKFSVFGSIERFVPADANEK